MGSMDHATRSEADLALAERVYAAIADRLALRTPDVVRFMATGRSWEPWCVWEALAAFHEAESGVQGWTVTPQPRYAEVGVTGSRESADLLVFDPVQAKRVIVELTVIHDLARNTWIDQLDGDTVKLRRLPADVTGLQMIVVGSLASRIDVNPLWRQWLAMSKVWNRPTTLERSMPLGSAGEMIVSGWMLGGGG